VCVCDLEDFSCCTLVMCKIGNHRFSHSKGHDTEVQFMKMHVRRGIHWNIASVPWQDHKPLCLETEMALAAGIFGPASLAVL